MYFIVGISAAQVIPTAALVLCFIPHINTMENTVSLFRLDKKKASYAARVLIVCQILWNHATNPSQNKEELEKRSFVFVLVCMLKQKTQEVGDKREQAREEEHC